MARDRHTYTCHLHGCRTDTVCYLIAPVEGFSTTTREVDVINMSLVDIFGRGTGAWVETVLQELVNVGSE